MATANNNSIVNNTYNNIVNTVSSIWNYNQTKQIDNALERLSQDQLIQVGDHVRDIFKNTDFLNPPTLCVIGTQSSGKSITLNGLIGLDILPNGKSIVTRTPIHLRLIHTTAIKETKVITVEFYENSKLISIFNIDALTTSEAQILPIQEEIFRLTTLYAGNTKNVVDIPIDIKIKSPNVPNLSIIDLPGLTNIALTDQGQPENIKLNIEKMLINYIKNPRTIILSIIPATIDVESDMGLGLIKDYDPQFKRTIGVLTKIDMIKDANIEHYLSGNISKNLQLGYGYYAVRNRSSEEIKTVPMSVKDGYLLEQKFFSETVPYNTSGFKHKMGSNNLGNQLSEILLTHLRACLPEIIEEIKITEKDIDIQLNEIGRNYPSNETEKRTILNVLLHNFQAEYTEAIIEKGSLYNVGAQIEECFRQLNTNLNNADPFPINIFTDTMIQNMIKDYNGIHMPDITISVGLIERCFKGFELIDFKNDNINDDNLEFVNQKKFDPLHIIKDEFIKCIKDIQNITNNLVFFLLKKEKYSRFPKLCSKIKEIVSNNIIPNKYEFVCDRVNEFLFEETQCIWTNDHKFRCEILPSIYNKSKDGTIDSKIDTKIFRNVLLEYFNVIKNIACHVIRKKITVFYIGKIINDINIVLIDQILTKSDLNILLEENKEKTMKREKLIKIKEKITLAKNMMDNI